MSSTPTTDRPIYRSDDEEIPILERKKKLNRPRQEASTPLRQSGGEAPNAAEAGRTDEALPGGGETSDAGQSGKSLPDPEVPEKIKDPISFKGHTIYFDGRSSCTEKSLRLLHRDCGASEDVKFILPTPEQRADSPPPNCFTLYESFIRDGLLWFPIPEIISEFLGYHRASFAQLTPRAVMHLVGVLVRSFEEEVFLSQEHLFALLYFAKAAKSSSNTYYLTNYQDRRLITGFDSKENYWKHFFFFVPICEATVGTGAGFVHRSFNPIANKRGCSLPDGFAEDLEKLRGGELSWKKFSLRRVNAARAKAAGIIPTAEATVPRRPSGVVIGERPAPQRAPQRAPKATLPSKKDGKRPMSEVGNALAKRKRAEEDDVGKKAAPPKKQKQVTEPSMFELEKGPLMSDEELSRAAEFFSGIKFTSVRMPSVEDMVCSRTYGRVAHASLQQNAEVSRMSKIYELRIANLQDRVAELEALEEENSQLRSENERLVASEAEKDEELGRLKAEVEIAAWSARKEADMMKNAKARLLRLRGEPLSNFILGRQNAANLSLVKEIREEEKKTEGGKSLEAFEKEMTEWEEYFQAAGPALDKEFEAVLADLGTAPVPTNPTTAGETPRDDQPEVEEKGEGSDTDDSEESSEDGSENENEDVQID